MKEHTPYGVSVHHAPSLELARAREEAENLVSSSLLLNPHDEFHGPLVQSNLLTD